jgi:RHS repeat-associated protein
LWCQSDFGGQRIEPVIERILKRLVITQVLEALSHLSVLLVPHIVNDFHNQASKPSNAGAAMSSPEQVLVCRYRYDPLDRLTSHNLPEKPELQRFYCKSRLATEVEGTIGYSIVQHDGLLLAQQRRSEQVETALSATDLQRSVLQTVKTGQRHPFAYSPYGHRAGENGLSSLLGFNGERPDQMTGHYLLGNGYRAFNPSLMRFNSPDSFSPFGNGGLNPYTYCLGDPINLSDPNGHSPTLSAIFQTIAKKLGSVGKTVKATSKGANELVTPAGIASQIDLLTPASSMGLFEKLRGSPHLIEKIIHQIPGKDMAALAQTSSEMKNMVYGAAKPLPNHLSGVSSVSRGRFDNGYTIIGNSDATSYIYDNNIQRIGSGMEPGILPVQLPQAGIQVSVPAVSINNVPGFNFAPGHLSSTSRNKNFTIRKGT